MSVRALDASHRSAVLPSRLVEDLIDESRAIRGTLHVDRQPIAVTDCSIQAATMRATERG